MKIINYIDELYENSGGKPLFVREFSKNDLIITPMTNIDSQNIKILKMNNGKINVDQIIELVGSNNTLIIHGIKYINENILKLLKNNNIKLVFYIHDYYLLCERYTLINNNKNLCSGPYHNNCIYCYMNKSSILNSFGRQTQDILIPFFSLFNKRINYYKNRLERMHQLISYIDLMIAPSEKAKSIVSKFFKNIKIEVIHHFPNTINCNRQKSKEPIFAFIGHDAYHKGYEVIEEILEKIQNKKFKLLMYGKFDKKIKDKRLEYKGEYNYNNIENIQNEFDVLLFPSKWPEVFGRVITESAICKKFIIASNITPAKEILSDYKGLYVYNHNNIGELIKHISYFIKNWNKLVYPEYNNNLLTFENHRGKIINILKKLEEE